MENPKPTLVDKPTDDLLIRVPDKLPLLDVDVVDGTCVDVRTEVYQRYNQKKLVLTFRIHEPSRWEGTKLDLFVVLDERSGPRSKLSHLLSTVAPEARPNSPVRKKWFLNRDYRLQLREAKSGSLVHSVVDSVIRPLTG